MQNKRLQNLIFIAIFFVILGAVFVAQHVVNQDGRASHLCDISNSSCRIQLSQDTLNVYFKNKPVIEEELTLIIEYGRNTNIKKVTIEGINTFMGIIPVAVQKKAEKKWIGWTMLGACSQPDMLWQVNIEIEGEKEPRRLIFETSIE